jgi:hypothetical protein
VSLQKKTFSQIKPQTPESYDSFFQFKHNVYPFSEGLTLNNVHTLSAINDSAINNYSFLFLTNRLKDSDIYSFDTKQIDISNVVGTIEFPNGFLYFDNVSTLGVLPINVYNEVFTPAYNSISIQPPENINVVNNSFFEIVIVDSLYCKIRHCVDDWLFYLVYQPGVFPNHDFYFTKTPQTFCVAPSGVDNSTFYCLYDSDDGYMSLYKPVSSVSGVNVYGVTSNLSSLTLTSIATGGYINSSNNLVKVSTVNAIDPKINTSWVSYNIDNIEDGHINDTRSRFNIKDNHLLTFEYSNSPSIQKFRDLKLKNILTDTNTASRGGVFDSNIPEVPSVNHREYTTIATGNDEETGYPNITLSYTMFSKDVLIKPGKTTLFQTGSSLYPYNQLNINDTTFAVNGSLGGSTPAISDRITANNKLTKEYNGGRYLTTWLSAGDINTKGVWVDRYYLPNLTTKQQAFSSIPVYAPTFQNEYEQLIYNNAGYLEGVTKSPVFDKKSDVVFRPGEWYEYNRIGKTDISEHIDEFQDLVIENFNTIQTFNGVVTYDTPENILVLDGNIFSTIPSATINENNSFTLKFDYDIDWNTNDFYQLIGNKYQIGFGIFKNYKVTPFVYIVDNNKLRVYNTSLDFLFETILVGGSGDAHPIETVIISKYLGDLMVIDSGGSVYKITTEGVIKQYVVSTIPAGYLHWTQDDVYGYFLYSDGSCKSINLKTLAVEDYTVTPFDTTGSMQYLTIFNGVVYGTSGECIKYDDTYGFVQQGTEIYRYNFKTMMKEVFATCTDADIICTVDDEMFIYVADCDSITKLTKNRKYVNSVSTQSLSSVPLRIDTISEFDDNGNLNVDIVYVSRSTIDNSIIITKYDKDLVEVMYKVSDVTAVDSKDYVLSNYNLFDHVSPVNSIRISIALVNLYDRKDVNIQYIDVLTTDLSNTGTFVIRCDTNQGNFTVFNNYQKLGNITFNPAKYRPEDLFYDDIFLGTAGMSNNTPLMRVVNRKNYFTIRDASISNLKLYNRPLLDHDIQALLLESVEIQDLVLTLPCGQRNNLEEIKRTFFFQPPNSKSTDIDVIIKNSTINIPEIQTSIKDRILIDLKQYIPGNVNINNITFTQYKDDEN